MTNIEVVGWSFALLALTGASVFFWREKKTAGFSFVVVFIVLLAGVSQKRVVLTSAILGLTLERDAESRVLSK